MALNKSWKRRCVWAFTLIFIFINSIAIFHAYRFTHFSDSSVEKTKHPEKLTTAQKINTLIFGVKNPRPENKTLPDTRFETIILNSNKQIECWSIKTNGAKGTVVLFHGFGGAKSSLLDKSDVFAKLGYNTFIVDFMGCGGSEGRQTTIGFSEAEQVKTCFDYIRNKGEKNIYLFGTSMGAAAIMKSIYDHKIDPSGVIIECPFGTMYQTVCARFESMHAPAFPMAALLVFWGGILNGFWAFGHNPSTYATGIHCPTLLLYGEKDEKVTRKEIDEIYFNLAGTKSLKVYPEAAHENYLRKYKNEWTQDIQTFLMQ